MSASGWLITAVRTCNPFQKETNVATVLSSPKRPGPRATSPPAWSQYLHHKRRHPWERTCNLLQTWWHLQKHRISTKLYGALILPSFLYLAVNRQNKWSPTGTEQLESLPQRPTQDRDRSVDKKLKPCFHYSDAVSQVGQEERMLILFNMSVTWHLIVGP